MRDIENEIKKLRIAVDLFSDAMKDKLEKKVNKGFRGWDDPLFKTQIISGLRKHILKDLKSGKTRQMVDVANLAMMLWWQEFEENTKTSEVENE